MEPRENELTESLRERQVRVVAGKWAGTTGSIFIAFRSHFTGKVHLGLGTGNSEIWCEGEQVQPVDGRIAELESTPSKTARVKSDAEVTEGGIASEFRNITGWMMDHGAWACVENLGVPCTAEALQRAELQIGRRLPEGLKELYRLHDGQREQSPPFLHGQSLLSIADVLRWGLDSLMTQYIAGECGLVAQAQTEEWKTEECSASGLRPEEISDRWWPFAAGGKGFTAINLDTQRVFWVDLNSPSFSLAADDLRSFFQRAAAHAEAGRYYVDDPGFPSAIVQLDGEW